MNYIIFDLEATCWDQHDRSDNETIEIGAVKIDQEGNNLGEFQTFVKPLKHPQLSEFCKQLTSISQENVDSAPFFYEAIADFKEWIDVDSKDYLLCSWGFYDRKQLETDAKLAHLDIYWLKRHISVKHQHYKLANTRRALGMAKALAHENLKLEGTHHRGIDDARNIARIFTKNLGPSQLPQLAD